MKRFAVITVCALLFVQGGAFAHEGEKHEQKHKTDTQMQKLHGMMPMYAMALAKLEAALEKGDAAAVGAEAGKMLATTPDLRKGKPHKNLKQLKTFRSIAAGFENDLKEMAELANNCLLYTSPSPRD